MENKEVIYNDDVERIVNDPERQAVIDDRYYKRQMHRQRKMLTTALLYAFFAAAFGALGLAGCGYGSHIPSASLAVFGLRSTLADGLRTASAGGGSDG